MAFAFATGVKSFDTASDVTVEFNWGCAVAPILVSGRDFPLGLTTGAGAAVSALLDPFAVVSSRVLIDVVALSLDPPVLTDAPAGAEVVFEPVDVEPIVDVFDGVEDAAELDVPVFGVAVDEPVDDDEPDGSAHAIPGLLNRTAPTPSATARPPIRPTWASPRTRQLYRRQ